MLQPPPAWGCKLLEECFLMGRHGIESNSVKEVHPIYRVCVNGKSHGCSVQGIALTEGKR